MPWFKIDDAFHGHPKVMELSPAAVGIWTLAGSWCANYLTDGEIKAAIVRRFGADDAMVQELVDAGLWIDLGGSYQFKDWDEYQPLKEEVMAERNAARERMKAVRAKKKGVERSGEQPSNVQPNDTGTFGGTSEEVRSTPTHPDPTRPDPTEEAKASSSEIPRPDVDGIVRGFSALLEANDVKHQPGRSWRNAARLLIDKDGYTPEQIMFVAKFATTDDFWKSNILSIPKLREKFEALKIKAQAQRKTSSSKPTTGDKMRDTLARGQALQERMNSTANQTILEIGA